MIILRQPQKPIVHLHYHKGSDKIIFARLADCGARDNASAGGTPDACHNIHWVGDLVETEDTCTSIAYSIPRTFCPECCNRNPEFAMLLLRLTEV